MCTNYFEIKVKNAMKKTPGFIFLIKEHKVTFKLGVS